MASKSRSKICSSARYYDEPISEEVERIFNCSLPKKLEDPGEFSLKVTFANGEKVRALIDLGAGGNLMPCSIYAKIGASELKPTGMRLEMADRTKKKAKGILEDVLVRIDELIVPVDFVVLDVKDDNKEEPYLLLGRPFMATTKMEIDMRDKSVINQYFT